MKNNMMKSFRVDATLECAFCMVEYSKGEQVSVLGCHEKHFMHRDCLTGFLEYKKDNNQKANCPLCRKEIDESKIK